ncbi:MAG: hypothetical protein HW421_3244 [Ignavibacteria bacterium]|nr:hypothetical protein [Ignavibacteria bacterium]
MKKITLIAIYSLLITALLLACGCSGDDNPTSQSSNNIKLSSPTQIGSASVGASGGVLTVNLPGNDLNNTIIEVPPGALPESRQFDVSYSKIETHTFGSKFNPITPMLKIRNGGGYSEKTMNLAIPIKLPAGHFAMAFLYNEKTGKLEGMPVIALSSTQIKVATRHFSTSSVTAESSFLIKNLPTPLGSDDGANIVVCSIDSALLNSQGVLSTGYKPGIDDWEFYNFGSYISPGGHCAGQSISSMWYFYEKKLKGNAALNHRYDKVSGTDGGFWYDNPRGYKFASSVQEALAWDGKLFKMFEEIETDVARHHLSWKAFAFSMYLTGEPQFVGLTSDSGGHAIVAYKMSLGTGELYVADPNFPGKERIINYTGNHFKPYGTMQNANEVDKTSYSGIGYYAKTSMIDWNVIGNLWKDFENETIGTKGNKPFPAYKILYNDGKNTPFDKGLITDSRKVPLKITWANGTNNNDLAFCIYDDSGNQLLPDTSKSYGLVINDTLFAKEGKNTYGLLVMGKVNGKFRWLDFKWIDVTCNSTVKSPYISSTTPQTGKTGDVIKLQGSNFGASKGSVMFNTTEADIVSWTDTEIQVKIPVGVAGTVSIKVVIYTKDGKLESNAYSFTMGATILAKLQKMKGVNCGIIVKIIYGDGFSDYTSALGGSPEVATSKITWSGSSFSLNYSYKSYPGGIVDYVDYSGNISGSVSADGNKLISCTFLQEHTSYSLYKTKFYYKEGGTISDVALSSDGYNSIEYVLKGAQAQNHASGLIYEYAAWDENNKELWRKTLKEVKWDNNEASVNVFFW